MKFHLILIYEPKLGNPYDALTRQDTKQTVLLILITELRDVDQVDVDQSSPENKTDK